MELRRTGAWIAWRILLIAGFGLVAALNLPGHLPLDSVTGLWEGRHLVRMSWGPRMYSLILGAFDRIWPGTALYTLASLAVTALAWAALPVLRRRAAWTGPVALACAFALPQVLIFQAVVWRDVLFADLLVAGFVSLALAARFWEAARLRWPLLAAAALALAVGALVRQNGGVVIVPAAIALGWIAAQGRWRRGLAWGAGGLVATLLLAVALNQLNPVRDAPGKDHDIGLRLLAHYDVMGALADDPTLPLPELQADRPKSLEVLRRAAPQVYSPTRIDTLDSKKWLQMAIWRFDTPTMLQQWRELVLADPLAYVQRRLEVFRWVVMNPRPELCGSLHLGVSGLPQLEAQLGLRYGPLRNDGRLYAYAHPWFGGPLYSHLTWALVAAAVAGVLLIRREPADIAIAGMMVGALAFLSTFFFLSIACDYRYLYAVDLVGITGVLYLALDPSLRRRKPQRP